MLFLHPPGWHMDGLTQSRKCEEYLPSLRILSARASAARTESRGHQALIALRVGERAALDPVKARAMNCICFPGERTRWTPQSMNAASSTKVTRRSLRERPSHERRDRWQQRFARMARYPVQSLLGENQALAS